MTKTAFTHSNMLIWVICSILFFAGITLAIHALLTINRAEVIVEWTTASELDTVGFNLQRGETPEGPFEQVNPELIPTTNDSLTGSSYNFEDSSVKAGVTYYYILEEVEGTGRTNQHGPIIVEAGSPSKTELLIAGLLVSGALIYAFILLRQPKQKSSPVAT